MRDRPVGGKKCLYRAAGFAICRGPERGGNPATCETMHKGPAFENTGPSISQRLAGQTEVRFAFELCHGALTAAAGICYCKTYASRRWYP